jgi:uncharacterized protein (TIGR02452 family)
LPTWEEESTYQLPEVHISFLKRNHLNDSIQHTTMIRYEKNDNTFALTKNKQNEFTQQVLYADSIDAALFLKNSAHCHPLIITCCEQSRCTAYLSGRSSQESEMCRRTNLFMCLDDPFMMDNERNWTYPIPEYGGIYVPRCLIFRESESTGYAFMKKAQDVSVLASTAYSNPPVEKVKKSSWMDVEWRLSGKIIKDTRRKIECMLDIAVQKGHDAVVFSDFGCGTYDSPAKHIAEIFKSVLADKFADKFKFVLFCMKDRKSLDGFRTVFHGGERVPTLDEFGDQIANKIQGNYSRMPYNYGGENKSVE